MRKIRHDYHNNKKKTVHAACKKKKHSQCKSIHCNCKCHDEYLDKIIILKKVLTNNSTGGILSV